MRVIPPELLSYIFTLVVENNSFGRLSPHPKQVGSFSLTRVCSQWREVALYTSEIWARLCIQHDFSPLADKHKETDIKRLRSCIVRAKSSPLFVEVVFEKKYDVRPEDLPNHTASTLLKELVKASNWGGLHIEFASSEYNFPEDAEDIFPLIFEMMDDSNLESLRSLEIHFEKVHDMGLSLRKWRGETTKFPNLRTLILHHNPQSTMIDEIISFGAVHSIFPYSQLTHVHVHLPCFGETLEVLRLCSQSVRSVHIELFTYHENPSPEVSLPPISFPFLASLVVNGTLARYIRKLLDAFELAPSLKSLSLSCMGYPDIDDQNSSALSSLSKAMRDFLARSGVEATLKKLRLSIIGVLDSTFPGSLLDILAVTTGVEELMISVAEHGSFVEDYWHPYTQLRAVDFLRVLARDDQVLPKLKNLHIIHLDHLRPEETKGSYVGDYYDEDEEDSNDTDPNGEKPVEGGHIEDKSAEDDHNFEHQRLNKDVCENGDRGEDNSEPPDSKQPLHQQQHEWVNEFESAVESRFTKGLRTVILELESVRGDSDKSDMGLDLERLTRLRELGLEIQVLRTRYGRIHHEVLGHGLGGRSCLNFHNDLWMRTPKDRIRN
ncbi:hypothetical protein L218DRAFT_987414 [Marasmius fiardii PR-910]|nr:hypothetical protein L218DRAFT_987414 [Marasmius fiardii PR-910]